MSDLGVDKVVRQDSLLDLSLAIGKSFDLQENCAHFFDCLNRQCGKVMSALFIPADNTPNCSFQLIYTNNTPDNFPKAVQLSDRLRAHLEQDSLVQKIQSGDCIPESQFLNSNWVYLWVGYKNLLLLQFQTVDLNKDQLSQLFPVLDKFGHYIDLNRKLQDTQKELQDIHPNEQDRVDTIMDSKLYKKILDHSNDSVLVYDYENEQILDCNQAIINLLNYPNKNALVGLHRRAIIPESSDYFPGVNIYEAISNHGDLVKANKAFLTPGAFKSPTGEVVLCDVNVIPIIPGKGTALLMIHDITSKEKNRKALRESVNKYIHLFENTYEAILYFDLNERKIINCNEKALELFEYSSKEAFLASNPQELHFPIDYFTDLINLAVKQGSAPIENFTLPVKDKALQIEGLLVYDQTKPSQPFIISFLRDVTERNSAIQARNKLFNDQEQFLDNMPAAFVLKDDKNNLLRVNRKAIQVSGMDRSQLEGKNTAEYTPKEEADKYLKDDLEVINSGMPKLGIIEPLSLPDGKVRWMRADKVPYRDESGNITGVMVYTLEVTDLIESQKQVEEKNAELKKYIESNLQLENFAYIASHDLKTPVRAIVSFSQLLQRTLKDRINEEEKEYLEFIIRASKNMQALIQDLLAYAKINSQDSAFQPVNIPDLLSDIRQNLRTNLKEKKGKILVKDIPETIIADPVKIRQLFQNLLTNGLKFSAEGVKPVVEITAMEKAKYWQFAVKDNGIGIAPKYQEKIFLLFRRLHGNHEYEGTGIGLSICAKIVEQHQGKIWLQSAEGEGSTFYFTLKKRLV